MAPYLRRPPPTQTGPSFGPAVVHDFLLSPTLCIFCLVEQAVFHRVYRQRRVAVEVSDSCVVIASFSVLYYVSGPYGMWLNAHLFVICSYIGVLRIPSGVILAGRRHGTIYGSTRATSQNDILWTVPATWSGPVPRVRCSTFVTQGPY